MPRVKRGVPAHARHKKVLNITKGQRGSKSKLFRRANEAMLKSLWYATRDRRDRKRDFRRLWIARINAAARLNGMPYNQFMHGLEVAGVEVKKLTPLIAAIRQQPAGTWLPMRVKRGAETLDLVVRFPAKP